MCTVQVKNKGFKVGRIILNFVVIALHIVAAVSILFASVEHPQAGYGLLVLGGTGIAFIILEFEYLDEVDKRRETYAKGLAKLLER